MGRKLRVDFSNEGGAGNDDSGRNDRGDANNYTNSNNNTSYNPPPPNGNDTPSAGGSALPPLPAGRDLPPGVTCTDAISRTLNTLPPAQLLDILSSMKQLASTDPARATELLNQAPQLSYAVFQALLLMGLVSPEAINAVLEPGSNPAAAAAAPPPAAGGYPPPAQQPQQPGFPGATNTPPVVAPTPYAPPPAPAPPVAVPAGGPAPAAAGAFGAAPGQNPDDLIQQVLSLPEEVIAQLPEAEKQAILQLRAQYSGQRV